MKRIGPHFGENTYIIIAHSPKPAIGYHHIASPRGGSDGM